MSQFDRNSPHSEPSLKDSFAASVAFYSESAANLAKKRFFNDAVDQLKLAIPRAEAIAEATDDASLLCRVRLQIAEIHLRNGCPHSAAAQIIAINEISENIPEQNKHLLSAAKLCAAECSLIESNYSHANHILTHLLDSMGSAPQGELALVALSARLKILEIPASAETVETAVQKLFAIERMFSSLAAAEREKGATLLLDTAEKSTISPENAHNLALLAEASLTSTSSTLLHARTTLALAFNEFILSKEAKDTESAFTRLSKLLLLPLHKDEELERVAARATQLHSLISQLSWKHDEHYRVMTNRYHQLDKDDTVASSYVDQTRSGLGLACIESGNECEAVEIFNHIKACRHMTPFGRHQLLQLELALHLKGSEDFSYPNLLTHPLLNGFGDQPTEHPIDRFDLCSSRILLAQKAITSGDFPTAEILIDGRRSEPQIESLCVLSSELPDLMRNIVEGQRAVLQHQIADATESQARCSHLKTYAFSKFDSRPLLKFSPFAILARREIAWAEHRNQSIPPRRAWGSLDPVLDQLLNGCDSAPQIGAMVLDTYCVIQRALGTTENYGAYENRAAWFDFQFNVLNTPEPEATSEE